jgi:CubicO group peptidase (beta-lactamase class C family)
MAALNIPGLSVAVFDSGQIVWTRSYGVADVNTGEKVDSSTLFQAASISKPVTSVGMFRLVEQGRLSLDEDVNERLRSWAIPENSFTRVEKVTPRRIVTHMGASLLAGSLDMHAENPYLPCIRF